MFSDNLLSGISDDEPCFSQCELHAIVDGTTVRECQVTALQSVGKSLCIEEFMIKLPENMSN